MLSIFCGRSVCVFGWYPQSLNFEMHILCHQNNGNYVAQMGGGGGRPVNFIPFSFVSSSWPFILIQFHKWWSSISVLASSQVVLPATALCVYVIPMT